jgi:DNA-binding SARP family transcriptional activator/energy-coupling factor transporter ATP-binding protein EcfA2
VEFRVLGPLEVRVHDRPLALGGTRPRAVLAALLLGRGAVVPVERLIAAVWGDDPPGTPTAQIQAAVSALRKALGADRIVTRSPGYLLRVERGELDLDEFDREVAAARRMREEGDLDGAAAALRAALQWWRDDALVDLAELPVRAAAVALDERRRSAGEERIEVDLALRRHAELVPELLALVAKQPLRDRPWSQLMRAQYRCGRRAEALETYRRARAVMREELGLEPAAELVAVHEAILADDPGLAPDVLPLGPREWVRPPCPYRALEAYGSADAEVFHGRRAEVAAVVGRLRAGPVTVVGPSGSGKSSLVLAGVLPALSGCTAVVVRPSDHGRVDRALAAALVRARGSGAVGGAAGIDEVAARIVGGGLDPVVDDLLAHTGAERLVVVLDQAEELLTQDAAPVDAVVTALFAPGRRRTVVATLRADFLSAVLDRPALGATLGGRGVFTLGAMGRDQLGEAITGPIAGLPGVAFEPGLVDRLLRDVGAEPGALALLGLTLTLLWDAQVDGTLTHEAYDDLGRVPGALAAHAEGEWRRRNLADDEPVLRRLVGHLVRVDPEGRVARRVARRAELDDDAWRLAVRLAPTRLLVVAGDADDAHVELAHEALLRHWPRLRGWVDDDAGFHAWRSALRDDLDRWRRSGRDPALLVRGAVLADARRWRAERGRDLGAEEGEFVERSRQHERTAGRRTRTLRAGLAAAAVLVLLLGVVFVHQRSRTADAAAEADSRALAARSLAAADDPRHAALLAVAAYDRSPTAEARDALFARSRDVGRLTDIQSADGVSPYAARASADGRVVALTTEDDGVRISIRRGDRVDRFDRPAPEGAHAEVAADGSAVWLVERGGIARLDVATGTVRTVVPVAYGRAPQIALSSDGTRILLRDEESAGPGPYRVRQWSTADGRELGGTLVDRPTDLRYLTVRAGPTARSAVLELSSYSPAGFRAELLDLGTGERTTVAAGASGSLSSDGSGLVTCTVEGEKAVLTAVGLPGRAPIGATRTDAYAGGCPPFVAGPRGRVAVDHGLGDMYVVDLPRGEVAAVEAFSVQSGLSGARPAVLTADGSRLVAVGRSWVGLADLTDPRATVRTLLHAEVTDDGTGLVGVSEDRRSLVAVPLAPGGPAAAVTRASTETSRKGLPGLAVGSSGVVADRTAADRIALHRLPGLDPLATVTLPDPRLDAMYFDTAGRLVTQVGGQVLWWDAVSGALRHRLDLAPAPSSGPDPTATIARTADPDRIAVVRRDRPDVAVHDVRDGRVVDTLPLGADVDAVSFQRGSAYVLVSRPAATEVWDGATKQRVAAQPVEQGAARVAAMTPEPGHYLTLEVVTGRWTLTAHRVGAPAPLAAFPLGPYGPGSFSGDAGVISLIGDDGTVAGVLRLDPAAWRRDVCRALSGADLPAEDRAAHPDVPPGPVCGAHAPAR